MDKLDQDEIGFQEWALRDCSHPIGISKTSAPFYWRIWKSALAWERSRRVAPAIPTSTPAPQEGFSAFSNEIKYWDGEKWLKLTYQEFVERMSKARLSPPESSQAVKGRGAAKAINEILANIDRFPPHHARRNVEEVMVPVSVLRALGADNQEGQAPA